MNNKCITELIRKREIADCSSKEFLNQCHVTQSFLTRLQLYTTLKGHNGCVNCIQWNSSGELLASGSDDLKIIVWNVFRNKQKQIIPTKHRGNIFSVKFLPFSNDNFIASGAMDGEVQYHDVEKKVTLSSYVNHKGRVKKIDVSPDDPNGIYSGSEDGKVMRSDIREPDEDSKVLLDFRSTNQSTAQVWCISINKTKPDFIAVGDNGPSVRVFDRRMIKPEVKSNREDLFGCIARFIPGHLFKKQRRFNAPTSVEFSPNGSELLVNLLGEQIYLYDTSKRKNRPSFLSYFNNDSKDTASSSNLTPLSEDVDRIKLDGNYKFEQDKFTAAIAYYNEGIKKQSHPILFANRAMAYIKRSWNGDHYNAFRDCCSALDLDPSYTKAYFRLINSLAKMKWYSDVLACIKLFRKNFPSHAANKILNKLEKEALDGEPDVESSMFSDTSSVEDENKPYVNDFSQSFWGHCNVNTDIKEANFFGRNGEYILAGSDDGNFFCWDRSSTNIVKLMKADEDIVNCVQGHPSVCCIATSGLANVVRVWVPGPPESSALHDFAATAELNQMQMGLSDINYISDFSRDSNLDFCTTS